MLLAFSVNVVSQNDSLLLKNAQGKMLKRLGKNALKQGDPSSAATLLDAYVAGNRHDAKAFYMLGEANMKMRDYEKAKRNFYYAYKLGKKKMPEALYYHALMQKSCGHYDSAHVFFQNFKKEYKGNDKVMKRQASKEMAFCDSVTKLEKNRKNISITRLDTSINKINTESAPIRLDDKTMIFSSVRTEKKEYITEEDTGKVKRKIYMARKEKGRWKYAGEMDAGLNSDEFNNGNASLSPDGKRLYFSRCKPDHNGVMKCALYVSEKDGDAWREPVKLPKNVNKPKYTNTMPAVTTDPAKGNDVIYYVSNNKEGRGGMDIWYTVYNKKTKTYREPKNAGSKINTSQNELTPFFDNETQSLYFSSDGLGGMGGYDVFKAIGDGKRFTGTENIGQPINTGADEIYYTISPSRKEGFFVSNRKGGNSLKNATCCDDIYSYTNNDFIEINLKGNINELLDPFEFIPDATVELYLKDTKTGEKFLVKTMISDDKGNYYTSVEPEHDYYLVVKKKEYLGGSGEVSTKGIKVNTTLEKDLQMTKIPKGVIHIPNIQYEFDRANLTEGSKLAIDTTIFELMSLNPELIVEIQSHTDSKGNDKYNMKLSQKRAESVVEYLVNKGIDRKRLIAKGYGETKPVVPNENADGTDNPEGRAKNRRTDFKIIGVIDAEIINDAGTE